MIVSKWVTCFNRPGDIVDGQILEYKCANCRNYNEHASDFCPHCGAKMAGIDKNYARITWLWNEKEFSLLDYSQEASVYMTDLLEHVFENGYEKCMKEITKQMGGVNGKTESTL